MAERKRNKEIHFYVTEEERKLIRRKMIESKTKNMGAYLRKMAIDGYIVNTDTTPLKKQYLLLHSSVFVLSLYISYLLFAFIDPHSTSSTLLCFLHLSIHAFRLI